MKKANFRLAREGEDRPWWLGATPSPNPIDTPVMRSMTRKFGSRRVAASEQCQATTASMPSLLESLDEFQFDWNVDVAVVARFSQKFADGSASELPIIACKFVHIHADEFTGEFPAHAARVGK